MKYSSMFYLDGDRDVAIIEASGLEVSTHAISE